MGGRRLFDEVEQFADPDVFFERVAEVGGAVDAVVVVATDALAADHAGFLQIRDDALGGALSDADLPRDLAQRSIRLLRETHEYVRVIGQKRPGVGRFLGGLG